MQRNGSPLTGVGTVLRKELADNLNSMRMRLLEILQAADIEPQGFQRIAGALRSGSR